MKNLTVGVGSKPNCGEMRLFNAWAGVRRGVGNRPGVTVEPKGGRLTHEGCDVHAVALGGADIAGRCPILRRWGTAGCSGARVVISGRVSGLGPRDR